MQNPQPVRIVPLSREHYGRVFELVKAVEPFKGFQYYDQFCLNLENREGFTYWIGDKLVGLISFSDYYPGTSVIIHMTFDPKYREAMNRKVIRHTFDYAFNKLKVHRINTYSIKGMTDDVAKYIKRIGFIREGCLREAIELPEGMFDLILYGMLRKDCKWV